MHIKRIVAVTISLLMVISFSFSVFASTDATVTGIDNTSAAEKQDADKVTENASKEKAASTDVTGEQSAAAAETSKEENKLGGTRSSSEWEPSDFTYGDYEKLLYGCDYSRQFTLKGRAVTGFSEAGKEKIKTNKDLVIPAEDTDGNTIVAVGKAAFKGQGITSVKFPSGMQVPYDDTVTHRVSKRGNFVIADEAFASNEITNVNLPAGVIAVLPNAFMNNKITTVTLPRTIWWIETQAFARNKISKINFPNTCDFQLEMHGWVFSDNNIKSVRLPDFTEVVNKDVFDFNPGMEPVPDNAPDKVKTQGGVVYMYTDNPELAYKQRIHDINRPTASQHSWHQKLVVNDGTPATQNPDTDRWTKADFTYDGTIVTGLSESGKAKRETNRNLVIPDFAPNNMLVTEIAAAPATSEYGLFADEKGFDSVLLPNGVDKIGDFAFRNNKLSEASIPTDVKEIGKAAFQGNNLSSVILPDTLTKLGQGAFATNPDLCRISLSKAMTEIPDGAFGCSDGKNWMANLKKVEIPENITAIGNNAFAGNNITHIKIPGSVKSIGRFAFSTKEKLTDPSTLELSEGLETIGSYAFRNKIVAEVNLPKSVTKVDKNAFVKQYSGGATPVETKIYVQKKSQYEDKKNFPDNAGMHRYIFKNDGEWTADDFVYDTQNFDVYRATNTTDKIVVDAWVVKGLSDSGKEKLKVNKNLVIPSNDPSGKKVQGVGTGAFSKLGIQSVTFPENVKAPYDGKWNSTLKERGDFFIGANSFSGNEIKSLTLPEGVIYIGGSAFSSNKLTYVKFPKTTMFITSQSFARNNITTLEFPDKVDFELDIDNMAFGVNKIESVQLPVNTEKMAKFAFFQNNGKEPVTSGTPAEKKGGIVYVYKADESGTFLDHVGNGKSNVQKLIVGDMPVEEKPWGIDDFTYDENGTTITGLSDSGKEKIKKNPDLILPDKGPKGTDITAIGPGAAGADLGTFGLKESADKIYLPKSVKLPQNLQTIGAFAFQANPITEISIPETCKEIGSGAFQRTSIKSLVLPESVTKLDGGAFANCAELKTVALSPSLTEISNACFTMTAIDDVVIPEGVTKIGARAFAGAHIKTLKLPDSVAAIGDDAFLNHQLTELKLPKNLKTIGKRAFKVYQEGLEPKLEKITMNEGLTEIGAEAFAKSKVKSTVIPNSLAKLPKDAFVGADPKVKLLTSNKEHLKETKAFYPKGSGHEVIFNKLAGTGWTDEDFTYSLDGTTLTGWSEKGQLKRKVLKDLVLPDKAPNGAEITKIGDAAFKIPDKEVQVTKWSADSINGMNTVDLPKNLKSIGNKAFEYNNFTAVDLKDGLVSIGDSAFHGNKLENVSIPDSVTQLGTGSFSMNNIKKLKISDSITKIPQGAFSMNIWMTEVKIPDKVTEIDDMAFAGARLKHLEIPASVTKIGKKAFHLHRLTELTIPGTVKEIGESAFEGTYKGTTLKKLTLGEGIESIGKYAFKEALLEEVTLPSSLKTLGEEPFLNNKGYKGDHVVRLYTKNKAHMAFARKSNPANPAVGHDIIYTGPNDPVNPDDPNPPVNPNNPNTPNNGGHVADNTNGGTAAYQMTNTGDQNSIILFSVIALAAVAALAVFARKGKKN